MNAFSFDFSKDKPDIREPIPVGTKLLVRMNYTPGGAPLDGALTKAKDANSDAQYLKAEFTVLRGPFKGRKFWDNMTFAGGKVDEKGQSIAAKITRGNIRLILDAARGISTKDESPEAHAKRVITGFAALQGLVFPIKVGFEPAKNGHPAKNKLGAVLTLDHKDYPKSAEELDNPVLASQAPAAPALPAPAAPSWGAGQAAPAPAPVAASAPPASVTEQDDLVGGRITPKLAPMPQVAPPAANDASPIPAWARG